MGVFPQISDVKNSFHVFFYSALPETLESAYPSRKNFKRFLSFCTIIACEIIMAYYMPYLTQSRSVLDYSLNLGMKEFQHHAQIYGGLIIFNLLFKFLQLIAKNTLIIENQKELRNKLIDKKFQATKLYDYDDSKIDKILNIRTQNKQYYSVDLSIKYILGAIKGFNALYHMRYNNIYIVMVFSLTFWASNMIAKSLSSLDSKKVTDDTEIQQEMISVTINNQYIRSDGLSDQKSQKLKDLSNNLYDTRLTYDNLKALSESVNGVKDYFSHMVSLYIYVKSITIGSEINHAIPRETSIYTKNIISFFDLFVGDEMKRIDRCKRDADIIKNFEEQLNENIHKNNNSKRTMEYNSLLDFMTIKNLQIRLDYDLDRSNNPNESFVGKRKILSLKNEIKMRKGQIYKFDGDTGVGKSTILKSLIDGLVIRDINIRFPIENKSEISYVPQEITFDSTKSSLLNFIYPRDEIVSQSKIDSAVEKLFELGYRIDENDKASKTDEEIQQEIKKVICEKRKNFRLSGGQKKLMAFTKVFLSGAKLILIDEGFAGLDEEKENKIRKMLKSYVTSQGAILLFVEHEKTKDLQHLMNAIKLQNPEYSDDEVMEEVKKINKTKEIAKIIQENPQISKKEIASKMKERSKGFEDGVISVSENFSLSIERFSSPKVVSESTSWESFISRLYQCNEESKIKIS